MTFLWHRQMGGIGNFTLKERFMNLIISFILIRLLPKLAKTWHQLFFFGETQSMFPFSIFKNFYKILNKTWEVFQPFPRTCIASTQKSQSSKVPKFRFFFFRFCNSPGRAWRNDMNNSGAVCLKTKVDLNGHSEEAIARYRWFDLPSWELSHIPSQNTFKSMFFLFQGWDMWSFPGGYPLFVHIHICPYLYIIHSYWSYNSVVRTTIVNYQTEVNHFCFKRRNFSKPSDVLVGFGFW